MFRLLTGLGFILWILFNFPLTKVKNILQEASLLYFSLAVLLSLLGAFLQAVRWKYLLSKFNNNILSTLEFLRYIFVGHMFNLILPTGIGGDAVKSVMLGNKIQSLQNSFITIFLARSFGFFALLLFALFGFICFKNSNIFLFEFLNKNLHINNAAYFILFVLALALILVALGFRHKLYELINLLKNRIFNFTTIFYTFILSLSIQGILILINYMFFNAVHVDIPIYAIFAYIPLVFFATMLPISIYGIGIREALMLLFFSPFSISSAQILSITILGYCMVIIQGVIGFFCWLSTH